MSILRVLVAAILLIAPTTLSAQVREPTPFPASSHPVLFLAQTHSADAAPLLLVHTEKGVPGVVRYAAVGALIGAVAGYGAYLVQENATPHTDHEMDPLVRFGSVSLGALAGAIIGTIVHDRR